jgi:ergothioneine biosynthesis protein EgtB
MDDASPPKWHLAHTTWFFETFLLRPYLKGYQVFHPAFENLFNSYYNGVGLPFARARRGFLSRPTLQEIFDYRAYVDAGISRLFESHEASDPDGEVVFRLTLGLHHEQQHQELILTDLKYTLGNNPLKPVYVERARIICTEKRSRWIAFEGGLIETGTSGEHGFVFDNETPRHKVYLAPYKLSSQLVTNGEYIAFIEDGGYERADFWLSDGWSRLQSPQNERTEMPLYWRKQDGLYYHYTLSGERIVDPFEPVCHVSGYEADAYARWKGCRLPLEAEWENAAASQNVQGNFVESGCFHPAGRNGDQVDDELAGLFGDVWEWTSTSYGPYPGYKTFDGQLGEYNGKFMANQLVLRGGSCASSINHIRATYRNFFYPPDRWQFSGIRLAGDA